jgi:hypothetical protein
MQNQKSDLIAQMTSDALTKLRGDLANGKSEMLRTYLATMSRFYRYSFGNQILISFQCPHATHVAGFQAWKKFNRFVKKGEKGIVILAPVLRKSTNDVGNDGEVATANKKTPRLVNVRAAHVFDISQTEGEPLPEFATVKGDPATHLGKLKELVSAKGITLEYVGSLGGAFGVSSGGKIQLLKGLQGAQEFSVLVHELAHELLHQGERRRETTKTVRETEAEAVAFVVGHSIGLELSTASSDYIQLYRGDAETLSESLTFIRNISSEVIAALLESPG